MIIILFGALSAGMKTYLLCRSKTYNAILQKFLKPYKQLFNQLGVDCKYFVKDEFNPNLKNCDDSKLSLFHLNIRSLNCHHKELSAYLC